MADLLGEAIEWLEEQRHAHATVSVIYTRGDEILPLQATIGSTSVEAVDEQGNVIRAERRDFIVRAADLVLAGGLDAPLAGDTITLVLSATGQTQVYEVTELIGQTYNTDPDGLSLRIHTQRITREAAT